ncbi:ABC transporter substrate-binding protein [Acuticoccus mangrovi]|uniref:Amino acid-binding protein n=1 Tax=Acuticoccus mangrovi TaxID=2796142 RepID=A0A934IKN9_9HYPH|nr:glycine betaine ABC transporter substrate-binding protein [Acuticoccus mangrovi]MBJ3774111.1 amino acid-binding protein [Acuticoccus mangrovi]
MSAWVRSILTGACALAAGPALAATVVVGVPAWPSAEVTASIIGKVLEEHYGVAVRLRPIGSMELLGAIDRGEVDIHPEIWLPNLQSFVDDYAKSVVVADYGVTAMQGLCTTRDTVEATGIKSVGDLAKPEMAAYFDTDEDGKGEMWIGPASWSSARIERVRAKSYGYADTMMLLNMPEDMAMASIDAAAALGQPVVFYCYSPHYVFALHDIVRLEEPPHDPATWTIVQAEDDPAWLAHSTAASAWEPSHFHIGYARALADDQPAIVAFLQHIALTEDDAAMMSYAVHVEGRAPDAVADAWLADNKERIEEWVK